MSHKTPQQCENGCCDDGCPPGSEPIVTAIQDVDGFHYTVTNATFAEVRAWCPSAAVGPPDETYAVILDLDGNASGTIAATGGCKYCIYARNRCDEALMCTDCDVPCCHIEILPPAAEAPGVYTVQWRQFSAGCNGAGAKAGIESIAINGVDVDPLPTPDPDDGSYSGSFTVDFGDSPDAWCMTVTNSCGVSSECCVDVPCCFRTNAIVLESSGFSTVHSRMCYWEDTHNRYEETVTVNGLSGINGSFVLTPSVLTGFAPDNNAGYCHQHPIPIPLGVFGSVEWLFTTTIRSHAFTDPCGNPMFGYTQKRYAKWTGEFALYLSDFGHQIVLMPSSKQQVTSKVRGSCITDPYEPCPAGRTEWSEDSNYCIYDVATPVGVHVATLVSTDGYGGPCPAIPTCDTVSSFCTVEVGAYERINAWGGTPSGYIIGCTSGLGATIRTCDNGVIGTSGCGAIGYGTQRRIYSVQV